MEEALLREVLVARQPIFGTDFGLVGYELLYRDAEGLAPTSGSTAASSRATAGVIIDGVLGLGLAELTGGDDAWINVPVELLVRDTMLDVPPDRLVLELLAGDEPETAAAIARHRDAGFRVALDGMVPGDPRLALVDQVDVVKVDLLASTLGPGLQLVRELAAAGVTVLAEKVEDPESFERAAAAGARLLQGFYFARPLTVRGSRPLGISAEHLGLLDELAEEEVDFDRVERLIRSDLTLSDRFLRLVHARSRGHDVASIRDGLVLLGVRAVQRWVSLLVLSATTSHGPQELVAVASVRARSCELLEELRGGDQRLSAFSLGMFSVLGPGGWLDAVTLEALPLGDEARAALQHGGGSLRPLLDVALAAERGEWNRVVELGRGEGIDPRRLARAYREALSWSVDVQRAVR